MSPDSARQLQSPVCQVSLLLFGNLSPEVLDSIILVANRHGRAWVDKVQAHGRPLLKLESELNAVLLDCFDLASGRKDIRNPGYLYLHGRFIIESDNQLPRFSSCPLNGSASYHPGQLLVSGHTLPACPACR